MRETVRVGASYILDWIVIVLVAVAGAVFNYITGYHRPFSLTDVSIAYPNNANVVSLTVVGIIAVAAPAVIIVVICLLSSNHPSIARSRTTVWREKLWNLYAGLSGLALSLAVTLFLTAGLKDIVGKPRPDLLARCNANVSQIPKYVVGGFGNSLDSEASALVTSGICRQPDKKMLDDGFAAFPSGHSSFSWAGLLYLSLWLCLRFSVSIPYLGHTIPTTHKESEDLAWVRYARHKKAAPPLWLAAVSLAPIFVAIFISASRYSDFHHAGIDIFAGCFIGIVLAWTSFRVYHMPVRRGYGFSWGNRSAQRAFFGDFLAKYVQEGHSGRAGIIDEEASVGRQTQSSSAGEEMMPYDNRGISVGDPAARPMPYSTIHGR